MPTLVDSDNASHLSVILDISPSHWHSSANLQSNSLSLDTFLSHLLTFLNAHVALKHENTLAIFGAFPGKSTMLYSSTDQTTAAQTANANMYPQFNLVDSTIVKQIQYELQSLQQFDDDEEEPCALVGALTKALCYVNRITLPASAAASRGSFDPTILPDPRILILSVSPDLSTSYIPIMNAIFSAQKLKVTIDVCQIYGPDTIFLQQAAHLTGGSYISLDRRDALLQYLMMSFLPPPSIRKIIAVPTQDKIDFRAACFCHKRVVDIGFVCSVCLSIFCQPVPVCSTCRTKFPIKTLQRLNASRPVPSATDTPRAASVSQPSTATSTTNGTRNGTGLPNSTSINVDRLVGGGTPAPT